MATPESKAKYAIAAKEIPYELKPDLDEDVVSTHASIGTAETKLAYTSKIQM